MDQPLPIDDGTFDQIASALWMVQHSGIYNMFMQAGEAYTAAMCVLAMMGNQPAVRAMNSIGSTGRGVEQMMTRWMNTYNQHSARWQALAETSPLGEQYVKAVERNLGQFRSEPNSTTTTMIDFARHHGLGWYKALVTVAEEACFVRGLEARAANHPALRGVTEAHLLKAAGAQLLK